ncbi:hypothetical protein FRB91_011682 [Serendipita sp. 411]|nr:hypothetical protein FRC15_001298 [Serendipita sp. 397]KAG8813640.1 hypothetical protein FRC19_002297 [Serendipita sp. 401]KAG8847558.1 hypothetical protein FRB91_011682 [Serendipita sp. 411]KAG8849263.1 hypothetical protein FRC20_002343 [Serendipita sp. 405]KAG9050245.1 hypothetical protein FS842_011390 [Serendipita sp. 407]
MGGVGRMSDKELIKAHTERQRQLVASMTSLYLNAALIVVDALTCGVSSAFTVPMHIVKGVTATYRFVKLLSATKEMVRRGLSFEAKDRDVYVPVGKETASFAAAQALHTFW